MSITLQPEQQEHHTTTKVPTLEELITPEIKAFLDASKAQMIAERPYEPAWWECPDWCTAHTDERPWPLWVSDCESEMTHSMTLAEHDGMSVVRTLGILRTDGECDYNENIAICAGENRYLDVVPEHFKTLCELLLKVGPSALTRG